MTSDRKRSKWMQQAGELLAPPPMVFGYVTGRAHARLTTAVILVIALFTGGFVLALALGTILVPGVLLLAFLWTDVRPPRGVLVTADGLVVVSLSRWNNSPSQVIALLAHQWAFAPVTQPRTLQLGTDRVTFRAAEFERLLTTTTAAAQPPYANPYVR